ncbi:Protein transport protein sec39 [Elsinoe australis]|uniref:Protein transport protein sec39 n=1 Tax=Elsinoe australis TaxID=40998 RepID=A0A2P8AI68_9PEZI|nr:Protein transport protein sec39 [Elsinoe australis]
MADALTKAQCILLAVNLASESQPQALRQLFRLRTAQILEPELVLRILLTYLPGVTPPAQYIPLISDITSEGPSELEDPIAIDVSSVSNVSDAAANKRLRKLTLLPLSPPAWPANAPNDILTRFICHRSYRIDEETGLITLLPDFIRPFLRHSEYLQLWSISVLLPLLRLQHEYYQGDPSSRWTLETFEKIDGNQGVELLLSMATAEKDDPTSDAEDTGTIGRDLKGIVAPWMYGHSSRKRRKMSGLQEDKDVVISRVSVESEREHSWEQVYAWLVRRAVADIPTVASAVENWDGPVDVDMGDFANRTKLMDDNERANLEQRYAQAAFAACYAVETNIDGAVRAAHEILLRIAELRDFIPPPDLATSVEQLATFEDISEIRENDNSTLLQPGILMDLDHPLTEPKLSSYHLLQLLVYSAYQFSALRHPTSIQNVARLKFFTNEEEQLRDFKQILYGLSQDGKRDEHRWTSDRMKLLWLWNWNMDPGEHAMKGAGPYGQISKDTLEQEIVVAMLRTKNLNLIEKLYIRGTDKKHRLCNEDVEEAILEEALRCYDNASNGNRHRGNMKIADDIVSFFRRVFPNSQPLARASALMAATHSMSFYALTLQHGVPFQPANIRASPDPLSLLEQILEQNPKAYTKLEDLISIGRNLAVASPQKKTPATYQRDSISSKKDVAKEAERRVIYMCISAALSSSDFDTAYSYLTSRLQPDFSLPSDPPQQTNHPSPSSEDDISWRAAYLAGRYNSSPTSTTLSSRIRLLEQRTELLSLALLLAPVPSLTEILNVYRRVEEEMTALLAQQAAEEAEHDDLLDRQRGLHGNDSVPGGFGELGVHEGRTYNQSTRTVGNFSRGYNSTETAKSKAASASRKGEEEAPVGLFDLARGAASALGRNAFPLRREGTAKAAQQRTSPSLTQGGFGGGAGAGKGGNQAAKKQKVAPREEEPAEEGDEWGAWDNEEDEADATASSRQGRHQDQGGDDEGEAWGWGEEPVATSPRPGSSGTGGWGASSMHSDASGERVRKRDMVANAVTGGLASGIGWVLGATPVQDQGGEGRR